MAVTSDHPAPYTSPSVIIGLIERHRNRGLPSPINADVLARAGVSDGLIPRTLQAMETLELIDEEGKPSNTFEGIRLAPEAEYKKHLEEWLKAVYSDIFTYVDPTKDDKTAIRDAFRSYEPVGQQPRMVTLFLQLCAAAGMELVNPAQPPPQGRLGPPRQPTRRQAAKKPAKSPKHYRTGTPSLPEPLIGLLNSLPVGGEGWTQEERDKFHATFGHVLDFCFPIVTEEKKESEE